MTKDEPRGGTDEVEGLRRREGVLSALVDTAAELATVQDTEEVLAAIVRRARMLLATDVAYLTLHDADRGDTWVRTTHGAVSEEFRSLRVPPGIGLGGEVASTHEARWSSNYPQDERFHHTSPIDRGVGSEGLVAVCGTPLVAVGEFMGVLFVAHRTPRTFEPGEVAALGTLADLAALALRQARTRAHHAEAVAELTAARERDRERVRELAATARAHQTFMTAVKDAGVQDVPGLLVELLGGWSRLEVAAGERRWDAGGPEPDDATEGVVVDMRARSLTLGRLTWSPAPGKADDPPRGARRIVERAGDVASLLLLAEGERRAARQREDQALLDKVLDPRVSGDAVRHQLGRAGLDLARGACVVVVDAGRSQATDPGGVVRSSLPAAVIGRHGDAVVVLHPGGDVESLLRVMERLVPLTSGSSRGPATAGVAGPVDAVEGLRAARAEAAQVATALHRVGRPGHAARAVDLGIVGLVGLDQPDLPGFVRSVVGPVEDWDAARGTRLMETLETWLSTGRSGPAAAHRLHVHPNTVAQRLARIGALLGEGWADHPRVVDLEVAVGLRRWLGDGTGP